MNRDTIQLLEAYFEKNPVLGGMPASDAAIQDAQRRLNCEFAPDYIEFLRLFGCGVVGPDPIYGLGAGGVAAMAADADVITETERFRAQRWPGVGDWYVISGDGRGNPIGIGPDGRVRLSDHDVGDIAVVAESFEEFLIRNLSR